MGLTNEQLLNELKAARLAIRQMKAGSNEFDEAFAIGRSALRRINNAIARHGPIDKVAQPARKHLGIGYDTTRPPLRLE